MKYQALAPWQVLAEDHRQVGARKIGSGTIGHWSGLTFRYVFLLQTLHIRVSESSILLCKVAEYKRPGKGNYLMGVGANASQVGKSRQVARLGWIGPRADSAGVESESGGTQGRSPFPSSHLPPPTLWPHFQDRRAHRRVRSRHVIQTHGICI
jgi:hypothetical protein